MTLPSSCAFNPVTTSLYDTDCTSTILTIYRTNCCPAVLMSAVGDVCAEDKPKDKNESVVPVRESGVGA